MGNWISLSFQRMNFLVADRIVSSCGVNIQLWASGAIFHYKDSEELLHLLATECNDNFHFCSNVQTIAPRPFKTFFTRFNLHMKGNNISKEFCFKFKRKLVSALCQWIQLIQYLKASQPQEDPFVGVIEFSMFIYRWKIQQRTQPVWSECTGSWEKKTSSSTVESREEPLSISSKPFLGKKSFNANSDLVFWVWQHTCCNPEAIHSTCRLLRRCSCH